MSNSLLYHGLGVRGYLQADVARVDAFCQAGSVGQRCVGICVAGLQIAEIRLALANSAGPISTID